MSRSFYARTAFAVVVAIASLTASASGQQCPFRAVFPSDAGVSDLAGSSVAIDGDTAVLGAPESGFGGAAYIYVRESDGSWTQQAKLVSGGVEDPIAFGRSVAIDGDTVVVGAKGNGTIGAAYVFERVGTSWPLAGLLTPDPTLINVTPQPDAANFANAVAIDGDTIAVGADNDRQVIAGTPVSTCGSVYVFQRSGGSWSSMESSVKLGGTDLASLDRFGTSVAIDGTRIVVGSIDSDSTGAAYVFDKPPTGWVTATQNARLSATDEAIGDQFGISVDVSGGTVIVGAHLDDNPNGTNKGAVYVFVGSGSTWEQQQKIISSNTGVSASEFGNAVRVVGDLAVINEPLVTHLHPIFSVVVTGAVTTYRRTGTVWSLEREMLPLDPSLPTQAAILNAIDFDGASVIAGSRFNDWAAVDAGAGFIFRDVTVDCNANGVYDSCDIFEGDADDENENGVIDTCECPTDFDADGDTDLADLGVVLSGFGCTGGGCSGDVDGDGDTDLGDLGAVLAAFGVPCG